MATNVFFDNYSNFNEQQLVEDLVIESIKMYGVDVIYITRVDGAIDKVFNEDDLPLYNETFEFETYVKNVDGFEGEGDFLSKFGLQIRDQMTLTVANRTLEKAERLIAELGKIESLSSKSSILIASGLKPEDLKDQHFDIVINATSVSTDPTLNLNLDKNIFTNASVALDLYYSQAFTSFMESAREASVPLIIDGWGMLVEQAAESFLLWTGTKPSTAVLVAKHGE